VTDEAPSVPAEAPARTERPAGAARPDGRGAADLRPVAFELGYQEWAEGSLLFEMGRTRVLVAASVEDRAPRFLLGSGRGWVTAEYSMLPRATTERTAREVGRGRPSGRTQEIQRLIGRSLRAVTDVKRLGERTITIDCDVLQADAGTRTASVTAGYVALALAVRSLRERGVLSADPLRDSVAGVSVGMVDGRAVLDLAYEEDARADVDFNVVITGSGALVEVQGTAEGEPFSRDQLNELVDLAEVGIRRLTEIQGRALAGASPTP
jgi:ribonuclease PH